MALDTAPRVRIWRFRGAPPEFQELFPEGRDEDWVAHVAEAELLTVGPSLLGWRRVYPVKSMVLADGSVVYCGAPREAMAFISGLGDLVSGTSPSGEERRTAPRVRIECPLRYETHSEPVQAGQGHTIDMSSSGISFSTRSFLQISSLVSLFVTWPVRLEGDVPIELRAIGRLVRVEAMKAALRLENISFAIAN
jgi:hypothetical protein